ncbi:hypothetical protein NDU88_007243 [Pleurodeles waltl]|uniref:IF rod domain-containing protein n=1 Tax=Pleurodeles waltl TaxID=8319 RepID=A0AAV7WCX6_PLEWA|nr:hypothetical protein NDU88_007243 [Pleurodeles waltl]
MSYDLFSHRKPWDEYRCTRTSKPALSSSYAMHRSTVPAKRSARMATPSYLEKIDVAQVSTLNTELLGLRAQEKEQLVDLNDRFIGYIEKVHHLEQQNKLLMVELEALRHRQADPSRLHMVYEQELRNLRAQLDAENNEKMRMEGERENLRDICGQMKDRYEEEARLRMEAEDVLQKVRQETDKALLANSDVEGSINSLVDEIVFLKKAFGEENADLVAQIQSASLSVEVEVAKPDLSLALKDVRSQYEKLANKNMQAAEDWYRSKFASVAELTSKNNEAVRTIREETSEYRRLLQSRSLEIEAMRNLIDSLNKQLENMEDKQSKEVAKYQEKINELENDIADAKQEMSRYLREYQELLNVKMALDIEIAAYRKLLEGEEIRLSYTSFPGFS